jgi:PhnB protein
MPVSPIPVGYHSIAPYLVVDNAAEAINFYQRAFNAVERTRLIMPDGSIGHAEIKVGNSIIMLGNESLERGFKSAKSLGGSPVSLFLYTDDCDATYATAIAAGATSLEPVSLMFWGDRMGKLIDPYGLHWAIATHIEDVSPAEIQLRLEKLYGSCG